MSKISLKHSGGNVVSLNSPTNAPGAADVAFKLPNADGSAGQFMKTDGSGNLAFATVAAGVDGITEADIWRLTQDVQGSQGSLSTLTAWERSDDAESTFIGTGMTYDSSGQYFHFPSTGKWLINVSLVLYGQYAFGWGFIVTQFRGSGSAAYDQTAAAWANVSANGGYGGGFSQCLVDVTETGSSGARVYFDQQCVSTAGRFIHGSTNQNRTSLAFIRLGDT